MEFLCGKIQWNNRNNSIRRAITNWGKKNGFQNLLTQSFDVSSYVQWKKVIRKLIFTLGSLWMKVQEWNYTSMVCIYSHNGRSKTHNENFRNWKDVLMNFKWKTMHCELKNQWNKYVNAQIIQFIPYINIMNRTLLNLCGR